MMVLDFQKHPIGACWFDFKGAANYHKGKSLPNSAYLQNLIRWNPPSAN